MRRKHKECFIMATCFKNAALLFELAAVRVSKVDQGIDASRQASHGTSVTWQGAEVGI